VGVESDSNMCTEKPGDLSLTGKTLQYTAPLSQNSLIVVH